MIILYKSGFGQNVLPIMKTIGCRPAGTATHQRENQAPCIIDVGRKVNEIFSEPPERDRTAEGITGFDQQNETAKQRNKELAHRTTH